jgi:hypothetical protein
MEKSLEKGAGDRKISRKKKDRKPTRDNSFESRLLRHRNRKGVLRVREVSEDGRTRFRSLKSEFDDLMSLKIEEIRPTSLETDTRKVCFDLQKHAFWKDNTIRFHGYFVP